MSRGKNVGYNWTLVELKYKQETSWNAIEIVIIEP